MKYYTADLHLFHNRLIGNRPFGDIQEMHDCIISKWRETVTAEDEVYVLGDVGMYHADEICDIIGHLPGRKYLITGNHDPWNVPVYQKRNVFQWIRPYAEIRDNDRKVVLFHYPIEEWDGYFRGFYHVHGHVHGAEQDLKRIPRRFNAGVDVNDFCPVTLDWMETEYLL